MNEEEHASFVSKRASPSGLIAKPKKNTLPKNVHHFRARRQPVSRLYTWQHTLTNQVRPNGNTRCMMQLCGLISNRIRACGVCTPRPSRFCGMDARQGFTLCEDHLKSLVPYWEDAMEPTSERQLKLRTRKPKRREEDGWINLVHLHKKQALEEDPSAAHAP